MWFITSGPSCHRRQAGLHSSSRRFRPCAAMRLVPNTDTVPASVNRYLLPHERQVITVHQLPAILIRPIFEVLIGLAIAGWLSNSIANGNGTAILVIWVLWGLVL